MKQESIIELKETQEKLEILKLNLDQKKELFEKENQELIKSINEISNKCESFKVDIRIQAIEEFKEKGMKQLLGGIGIRILTKLNYHEEVAIRWAESNMPIVLKTILDKKQFENYAKSKELDFVAKEAIVSVTFPKKIII